MSPYLFYVGFFLACHQAVSLKQHYESSSLTGDKIDLNYQLDDEVLEIESQKPDNGPDNFRETTSRYYFNWHLVAHKDKTADRCYLQRSRLTRGEVERRLNNGDETNARSLGVQEEWIDPAKASLIDHKTLRSVFGPEVAEFCRFEDVIFLGDGSFGRRMSLPRTGLRLQGLRYRRGTSGGSSGNIIIDDVPDRTNDDIIEGNVPARTKRDVIEGNVPGRTKRDVIEDNVPDVIEDNVPNVIEDNVPDRGKKDIIEGNVPDRK